MSEVADRIMCRIRAKGHKGHWVCTASDFLDIGSRAAVDRALSRLAKAGELRRINQGLYDLPRYSDFIKSYVPAEMNAVVEAIARRDEVRIMEDGIVFANRLHLTNAVPVSPVHDTDGHTRNIRVGGRTLRLRHAGRKVMSWHGRPAAPVAQALRWLGPYASQDKRVKPMLRDVLPDYVKKDLMKNIDNLPGWAASIARDVAGEHVAHLEVSECKLAGVTGLAGAGTLGRQEGFGMARQGSGSETEC